jgi:glutamyl-Q tRNA(Asp) synthetase
MSGQRYIGRFAPSPTGPLHAGSLVAALASWLDAKAHNGLWLVRIEDVDSTRCLAGLDQVILQQLAACGLQSDAPPWYQTQRSSAYQQALESLVQQSMSYPCACSRKDIETALQIGGREKLRHAELIYPGTCRAGLHGKRARTWRFKADFYKENWPLALMEQAQSAPDFEENQSIHWMDRRLGQQEQDVPKAVGDFVLKRADGCFAYQLAVVLDDADQGITDVVRGEDLADNTARQILLQRALHLPMPRYLHTPLVLGANGEKLSKQNGAQALDLIQPMHALNQAAAVLGLTASEAAFPAEALPGWVSQWQAKPHPV